MVLITRAEVLGGVFAPKPAESGKRGGVSIPSGPKEPCTLSGEGVRVRGWIPAWSGMLMLMKRKPDKEVFVWVLLWLMRMMMMRLLCAASK